MIHVEALPGTPKNSKSLTEIISIALREVKIFDAKGVDGIILENMHDLPYLNRKVGPEITAAMSVIAAEIRHFTNLPLGIQILAGANNESLAVAKAANLDFIRAEGFVFSHVADEGFMDGCAGELLRFRKALDCENIAVFTDVKKKHSSHSITADLSVAETVSAAEFSLSDGIILTGKSTSLPARTEDLKQARSSTKLPILIGSGITADNIEHYWKFADGFIVGSYFKDDGFWYNNVSRKRVEKLYEITQRLKGR